MSVSLKDFSARTLQEFQPDIFLKDGDGLSAYRVNAGMIALPGHTDGSIGVDVEKKSLCLCFRTGQIQSGIDWNGNISLAVLLAVLRLG